MGNPLVRELEEKGIVLIPDLLTQEQLRSMQQAFETRLRALRWNNRDGYEKTEPYRHMVQDLLTLDQGFVDAALNPLVTEALREYIGPRFELVEAKGWRSLPTRRDFHGWHGDAWYDQGRVKEIPREIKLGIYLTDVRSGAFNYIEGSHRKQAPRPVKNSEINEIPSSIRLEILGPAGLAFLFDTSGIHRQGVPMLEPRHAVFYNYHDSAVPLQEDDVAYYRYHPLILNAAFLSSLSKEEQRILGFGNKTNYIPAFERQGKYGTFHRKMSRAFDARLRFDMFWGRVNARLKRFRRSGT